MIVKVEKVANGYIIKTISGGGVMCAPFYKEKYVFGNLSSAFTWLREKFNEEDSEEAQGSTTSKPLVNTSVSD